MESENAKRMYQDNGRRMWLHGEFMGKGATELYFSRQIGVVSRATWKINW
jgi:hypothetical protein